MSNTPEDTELRKSIEKCFTQNDMTEDGCSDYEDIELFDTEQVVTDLVDLITLHTQKAYLGHFEYDDWEIGDDNKLRVDDYINCNHQRPHDGYEQNFEGQIVEHHVNQVPVVIYNVDPKDPGNSGEYADLQSLMMDGWTFTRIAHLTNPTERSE